MTLNGVMALILRYFKFVYDGRKTITLIFKSTFDSL